MPNLTRKHKILEQIAFNIHRISKVSDLTHLTNSVDLANIMKLNKAAKSVEETDRQAFSCSRSN